MVYIGDVLALLRSTHPGPALAVTVVAAVLGVSAGLTPGRVALLTTAMLFNQLSVGLSNDWIDADRDVATGRTDKPVALGQVSRTLARNTAIACVAISLLLTAPLGWIAVLVQLVFIASAWGYNAGLKSTVISVWPYIVSFGLLPMLTTVSLPAPAVAAWWAIAAGALLGVAAHFANVLPDLADDAATGVRGLPHRVGRRVTGVVIAVALAAASALVALGPGTPGAVQWAGLAISLGLAVATATLVVTRPPTRVLFRLIIVAALVDVVLLALSGAALIA
jgi:4-hydroxybenzoate polyprenyltransferase